MDNIEDFPENKEIPEDNNPTLDKNDDDDESEDNNDDFKSVYQDIRPDNENENLDLEWDEYNNREIIDFLNGRSEFRNKLTIALKDLNKEKEEVKKGQKFETYKNILLENVEDLKYSDRLDEEAWDGFVIKEEKEKFLWAQKIRNINEALEEYYIKLDPENKSLYNFMKENVKETFTDVKKEINGYTFNDIKIIKRGKNKKFYVVEGKKNEFQNFLEIVKKLTQETARSEFINILGTDDNIKITAKECLNELRDMEKQIIGNSVNAMELQDGKEEIEKIETAIKDLKENKRTGIRENIIKKSLEGKLKSIKEWAKDNKTTLGVGGTSLLLSIVSGISSTIPLLDKLKQGVKSIHKVGNLVEKAGKQIKKMGKELDNILSNPTEMAGTAIGLIGRIIQKLSEIPFAFPLIGIILVIGIFAYLIKRWIGR